MCLTCLPRRASQCLRVLEPYFRHRHRLVFSCLLLLNLVYGERANLKVLPGIARRILAINITRACCAPPIGARRPCFGWVADQALQAFPPPLDGILYLGNAYMQSTLSPAGL